MLQLLELIQVQDQPFKRYSSWIISIKNCHGLVTKMPALARNIGPPGCCETNEDASYLVGMHGCHQHLDTREILSCVGRATKFNETTKTIKKLMFCNSNLHHGNNWKTLNRKCSNKKQLVHGYIVQSFRCFKTISTWNHWKTSRAGHFLPSMARKQPWHVGSCC